MVPVVVAVLVMVRLAAPELLSNPSNCAPQNLICYKPCCEAAYHCRMNCSWEAGCKDVNHTLYISTDEVHAQENLTVWVESVLKDVKFNPPSANSVNFSRSKGILTLKWPGSSTCRSTLNEVRMRQFNHLNWTLGNCSSDDTTKGLIVATCHLEKNIRYEVQVRYRTDHWSSHWSSWTEPLGETLPKKDCIEPDTTYLFTGELESNRCYRFAVYKFVIKWITVGYSYLFHRNASLEDAIRVNVTNQTANSAVIQWKPPRALSDCPGLLKKYIVCCQKEQYDYDVNVSQTWYTIQNLQPDTVYLVGIWVSTANTKDNCKAFYRFLTKAPESKQLSLVLSFLFMGIFGGILVVIAIFYKRMKKSLFPALPGPANTEAVNFHTTVKTGQAQVKLNFMEPMEANSTMEPLVVEPSSDKEEPVTDTTMDFLGFVKGTEEEHSPKEDKVVSDEILLSEYKGQRFLSPVEESEDFVDVSHEENTGGGPHLLLNNTEAGDQNGIYMSQVPLSFKLFDKLVVIKNIGEGFDIPCSDGTST
ncbi:hypothetical protein E2320_021887 [Naja naja]|nr:hypothetical protein E2320_021887 [Naja naja]